MSLNLESLWSEGLMLVAAGAVAISLVMVALCSALGLCCGDEGASERKAALPR
jgi:hypothetical protein